MAVTVFALWALIVAAGYSYGFWYEMTPTPTHVGPHQWPADSKCILASDRPTLLMFVHPRCPCSRSSMNELAVLMACCRERVDASVVFFRPSSAPDDWVKTDLWESADRIPGVVVRQDVGGAEQRRFGALVSGETFLFVPSGELVFHGGITASRGHAGDNRGRSAVEARVLERPSPLATTPVFGCELESPGSLGRACLPTDRLNEAER
jgi:hypothetical protein